MSDITVDERKAAKRKGRAEESVRVVVAIRQACVANADTTDQDIANAVQVYCALVVADVLP